MEQEHEQQGTDRLLLGPPCVSRWLLLRLITVRLLRLLTILLLRLFYRNRQRRRQR